MSGGLGCLCYRPQRINDAARMLGLNPPRFYVTQRAVIPALLGIARMLAYLRLHAPKLPERLGAFAVERANEADNLSLGATKGHD